MPETIALHQVREKTLEMTIIRANGRVEHLGVISYWHRNPLKRAAFKIRRWLKELS